MQGARLQGLGDRTGETRNGEECEEEGVLHHVDGKFGDGALVWLELAVDGPIQEAV